MRRMLVLAGLLVACLAIWRLLREGPGRERAQDPLPLPAARTIDAPVPLADSPSEPSSPAAREPLAVESAVASTGRFQLEGRVLDVPPGAESERGVPAAGVVVRALGVIALDAPRELEGVGELQESEPSAGPSAITDAEGEFRLRVPDDGKRVLALRLVAEGDERHRGASLVCRFDGGETRKTGLVLARRQHGALAGRTLDAEERPLAGVEVVLKRKEEGARDVSVGRALSDANGAYRVENVDEVVELVAHKEGYTLLEAPRPVKLHKGGWKPCDIVLAPVGRLRIEVQGPAGEPLPILRVTVTISSAERYGSVAADVMSLRQPIDALTDAGGVARIEGLWAEQRLRVALNGPSAKFAFLLAQFERVEGERAVLDEAEGGAPLIVLRGEERVVRVRLAAHARVVGRVLDAAGRGFPDPWVYVRGIDGAARATGALRRSTKGDAEGRFELALPSMEPLGRVLITARDRAVPRSYVQDESETPLLADWTVLELGARASGEESVTLELRPTLAIAGRIVCEPGAAPIAVRVHAQSGRLPFDVLPTLADPTDHTPYDGVFRVDGLPPGDYDVELETDRLPTVWARNVAAGTEDLVLSASGTRAVKLMVEVVLAQGELAHTSLLTMRLRPEGRTPEVAELPARAVFREPRGWPPWMSQLASGSGGTHRDAQGTTAYEVDSMRQNPTTLELEEGLYCIGAMSFDGQKHDSFPIGTGLVLLRAGEYRVRFELPASGTLTGRVKGRASGAELFVALADARGELVPLDSRHEMRALCELGADGSFRLPLVPAGEFELRMGTRKQLEGGAWERRKPVRVEPGETLVVEIER